MAIDTYAKLGDIKGESMAAGHKDEIEVLSYSWGVTNSGSMGSGSGGGEGAASFHDMSFVHHIDKATPVLMQACASGLHLSNATITHCKPTGKGGQVDYLVIKMNDVIITGVTHGGSSDSHTENVSLAFAKVELEYKPQKQDGSLDAGIQFKYDIKGKKGA